MGSLNHWSAKIVYLRDQIFVDLTQSTVEHFATFEHVENAIREHIFTMTHSIDVEDKVNGCDAAVDKELK